MKVGISEQHECDAADGAGLFLDWIEDKSRQDLSYHIDQRGGDDRGKGGKKRLYNISHAGTTPRRVMGGIGAMTGVIKAKSGRGCNENISKRDGPFVALEHEGAGRGFGLVEAAAGRFGEFEVL